MTKDEKLVEDIKNQVEAYLKLASDKLKSACEVEFKTLPKRYRWFGFGGVVAYSYPDDDWRVCENLADLKNDVSILKDRLEMMEGEDDDVIIAWWRLWNSLLRREDWVLDYYQLTDSHRMLKHPNGKIGIIKYYTGYRILNLTNNTQLYPDRVSTMLYADISRKFAQMKNAEIKAKENVNNKLIRDLL